MYGEVNNDNKQIGFLAACQKTSYDVFCDSLKTTKSSFNFNLLLLPSCLIICGSLWLFLTDTGRVSVVVSERERCPVK